jgi:hypothetical protein
MRISPSESFLRCPWEECIESWFLVGVTGACFIIDADPCVSPAALDMMTFPANDLIFVETMKRIEPLHQVRAQKYFGLKNGIPICIILCYIPVWAVAGSARALFPQSLTVHRLEQRRSATVRSQDNSKGRSAKPTFLTRNGL